MNSVKLTFSFSVITLVLVAGCGKSSGYVPTPVKPVETLDVTKVDPASLWPIKKGSTWTYEVTTGQSASGSSPQVQKQTVVFTVENVTPYKDGIRFMLSQSVNGKKTDQQMWERTSEQIAQVWIGQADRTYTPPQPTIVFPVQVGKEFAYKGVGPTLTNVPGQIDVKSKIMESRPVDTGMGELMCVPIETTGGYEANDAKNGKLIGQMRTVAFFAPNVGLAKFTQVYLVTGSPGGKKSQIQAEASIVLKQYTPAAN